MTTTADGVDLADAISRGVRRSVVVANLTGALVIFLTFGLLSEPTEDQTQASRGELGLLFVVVSVAAITAMSRFLSRSIRPLLDGLRSGALDVDARRTLFATPRRNAATSLTAWAAASVVFAVHGAVRGNTDGVQAFYSGITILLGGGVTTSATVFLFVERVLEPAYGLAFATEAPSRERIDVSVGARLLWTWALAGAIPLSIMWTILAYPGQTLSSAQRLGYVWVFFTVPIGFLVTRRAARSVSTPLEEARAALARVRAGDLDTVIHVDDATEVGLLQAGFNEMTAGLRERERLRDLFGRHVGEEVAQRALDSGLRLGGERVEASALFIDLTGSTELATRLAPEALVEMLNDLFGAVVGAVEREGGWVNKFEGDAALCVFGPPVGHPDHAARALRAAVGVRGAVSTLRARWPELDAGIGVSSGEVVAGNVGAEQRYEYTVIGDPVNEAARITDLAKSHPGRVLASGASVAGSEAGWRPVDRQVLRGRSEPTELFAPS